MLDDHAYSEPWHSQNSLFKHFQGYLDIAKDIDAYSAKLTGGQLRGRGKASPAFFENRKNCPDFEKIGRNCVDHWVKCYIQNVVLEVSRRKN